MPKHYFYYFAFFSLVSTIIINIKYIPYNKSITPYYYYFNNCFYKIKTFLSNYNYFYIINYFILNNALDHRITTQKSIRINFKETYCDVFLQKTILNKICVCSSAPKKLWFFLFIYPTSTKSVFFLF